MVTTKKKTINFRELADIKLPKAERAKRLDPDALYDVQILERDVANGKVKIHFVGYSSSYDEWRSVSELVDKAIGVEEDIPFSLHEELASRIKASLSSSRKSSPEVKIEMPFDKQLFDKGLRTKAWEVDCTVRGNKLYTISCYDDLDDLLGKNWHIRGLNPAGYPLLDTIRFYIRRRRPLVEYAPISGPADGTRKVEKKQGFILVFLFVRGDGLHHDLKSMYKS